MRREGGPARQLLLAADDRCKAMRGIIGLWIGAYLQPVEHIDPRRRVRRQRRSDARALAQLRDEKIATACGIACG